MIYASINSITLKEMLTILSGGCCPIRFRAHGSSMYPFIKNGSLITIAPYIHPAKPRKGDITLIYNDMENCFFVHRIVDNSSKGFYVKGDNCSNLDGFFSNKHILGYVAGIEDPFQNKILGISFLNRTIALFSKNSLLRYVKPIISTIRIIKRFYGQ